MSAWVFPTTADAGMRIYAPNLSTLMVDAALGVQAYLMSPSAELRIQQLLRQTGEWRVRANHSPHDRTMLFVAWLDEILYRNEVHQQWLTEVHLRVEESKEGLEIIAQVSWVDGSQIEREIEIKAVTTHELQVGEVEPGKTIMGGHEDVPDFVGPGWIANVVFDI